MLNFFEPRQQIQEFEVPQSGTLGASKLVYCLDSDCIVH